MSRWHYVVPLLATRCLYQGGTSDQRSAWSQGWPNVKLTWCSAILGHQMPLPGGMSELRSTRPNLVPLLATRCLYQGVHLTKGQPDPKADQMSSWPDVVLFLATRCLYWGYVWPQVSLTQRSDKNVNLSQSFIYGGSIWLECKNIWNFEHTLRFMLCFTEVFSTKFQQEQW